MGHQPHWAKLFDILLKSPYIVSRWKFFVLTSWIFGRMLFESWCWTKLINWSIKCGKNRLGKDSHHQGLLFLLNSLCINLHLRQQGDSVLLCQQSITKEYPIHHRNSSFPSLLKFFHDNFKTCMSKSGLKSTWKCSGLSGNWRLGLVEFTDR